MRPGWQEILVIGVLILIVFGPQRLPEIARQIGNAVREVRRVSGEFERQARTALALDEKEDDYGGNFPKWKGPPKPPMEHAESPPPVRKEEPKDASASTEETGAGGMTEISERASENGAEEPPSDQQS